MCLHRAFSEKDPNLQSILFAFQDLLILPSLNTDAVVEFTSHRFPDTLIAIVLDDRFLSFSRFQSKNDFAVSTPFIIRIS